MVTGEAGGIVSAKPAKMLAPSSEAGTGRPKKTPWTWAPSAVSKEPAFDPHSHVQLASERDDRLDHQPDPAMGTVEALHEGSIDLDLIERKAPQIAEARIAGPEIVHHDGHAHRLERQELHHDRFGRLVRSYSR